MKIFQRIGHVFRFATAKETKKKETAVPAFKPRTLIINDNLKFDAQNFVMFMMPYHPKIIPNNSNYLEVDTTSTVLELSFVDKAKSEVEKGLSTGWSERKSFQFTFKQLHLLLDVEMGSNSSVSVNHPATQKPIARYLITDIAEKKEVQFEYQQLSNEVVKAKSTFSLDYSEYSIFQDLLKESIYDLSGLPLAYELKKQEVIQSIKKEIRQQLSTKTQKEAFYQ